MDNTQFEKALADLARAPLNRKLNAEIGHYRANIRQYQLDAYDNLIKGILQPLDNKSRAILASDLSTVTQVMGDIDQSIFWADYAIAVMGEEVPMELVFRYAEMLRRGGYHEDLQKIIKPVIEYSIKSVEQGSGYLLIPGDVCQRYVGELSEKLDLFIKMRALGWIPNKPAYMVIEDQCANVSLREYYGEYIHFIAQDDLNDASLPPSAYYLDHYIMPDGVCYHRNIGHRVVQQEWEKQGRSPILSIKAEHAWVFDNFLMDNEFDPNAPLVVFHIRSANTYGDEAHPDLLNAIRNAELDSYYPAMIWCLEQGMTVMRIGDSTMPHCTVPEVLDLAHTSCPDYIQISAIAQCQFMVGMSSGPKGIAMSFQTPFLGTNWFPLEMWPYTGNSMFIHKVLCGEHGPLSPEDIMSGRIPEAYEPRLFDRLDISVSDNDEVEIRDAVEEMYRRSIRGDWEPTAVQARLRAKLDPYKVGLTSLPGCNFSRMLMRGDDDV